MAAEVRVTVSSRGLHLHLRTGALPPSSQSRLSQSPSTSIFCRACALSENPKKKFNFARLRWREQRQGFGEIDCTGSLEGARVCCVRKVRI